MGVKLNGSRQVRASKANMDAKLVQTQTQPPPQTQPRPQPNPQPKPHTQARPGQATQPKPETNPPKPVDARHHKKRPTLQTGAKQQPQPQPQASRKYPPGTPMPFDEALAFVHSLQLPGANGWKEWQQWKRNGARPAGVPSHPDEVYKNGGWQGWAHWVGAGATAHEVPATHPKQRAPKNEPRETTSALEATASARPARKVKTSAEEKLALVNTYEKQKNPRAADDKFADTGTVLGKKRDRGAKATAARPDADAADAATKSAANKTAKAAKTATAGAENRTRYVHFNTKKVRLVKVACRGGGAGEVYASVTAAARAIGCTSWAVSMVCRKVQGDVDGYHAEFVGPHVEVTAWPDATTSKHYQPRLPYGTTCAPPSPLSSPVEASQHAASRVEPPPSANHLDDVDGFDFYSSESQGGLAVPVDVSTRDQAPTNRRLGVERGQGSGSAGESAVGESADADAASGKAANAMPAATTAGIAGTASTTDTDMATDAASLPRAAAPTGALPACKRKADAMRCLVHTSVVYPTHPTRSLCVGMMVHADLLRGDSRQVSLVRVVSRAISPKWGSIRSRPLICAYAPWGVRVDELAKS